MPFFRDYKENDSCSSSEQESIPYHIYYARDFADTQIELFESHEIDELMKLKEAIESHLFKIQENHPDPYLHEDVPWRSG